MNLRLPMMNSIYIHIPFCDSICTYCDFTRVFYKKEWVDDYLVGLQEEINSYDFEESTYTIYIGGGTPSSLSMVQLEKLLGMLQRFLPCEEFTIECNPESLTKEKLLLMKRMGVNRLSIGVQSFDETLLKLIGRKHTKEDIFRCIQDARKVGFENISIDLMYNLPMQTIQKLDADLKIASQLPITHLSYYSLILEERTKLSYEDYLLEDDFEFSEYIKNYPLPFKRYEVSNYALPHYESKHNTIYWLNQHYYGLGAGAHGYLGKIRYHNTLSPTNYIRGTRVVEKEEISLQDEMFETIMLGLRLVKGIDLQLYYERFGVNLADQFQMVIDHNIRQGLLEIVDGYLRTTSKGMDLLDDITLGFME